MSRRILIVEDNKTLAKLISKKIETALDFKVDVAYSLGEAKLFLKMYKYFITLLDINLPDAPNGELVDYVLSKGNRAIVSSANIDKNFRQTVLKKNIIEALETIQILTNHANRDYLRGLYNRRFFLKRWQNIKMK